MGTSEVVAIVAVAIAFFNSADNLFTRYVRSRSARYAAEQDYMRLKEGQQNLAQQMRDIKQEVEKLEINVVELSLLVAERTGVARRDS